MSMSSCPCRVDLQQLCVGAERERPGGEGPGPGWRTGQGILLQGTVLQYFLPFPSVWFRLLPIFVCIRFHFQYNLLCLLVFSSFHQKSKKIIDDFYRFHGYLHMFYLVLSINVKEPK